MIVGAEMQEYLDEIRQVVCSRCVERPSGGPPCGPLGKPCGVELHLPELVAAVRQLHSDLIAPYLETNREEICRKCPFLHSDFCPCPMDTLAVLVVEAIEDVDQRRQEREQAHKVAGSLPGHDGPDMVVITRAYEEAAGTWTGCDWPTQFGLSRLNLDGWTAAEAEAQAVEVGRDERLDWEAAALWLEEVERRAREAEAEAERAITAASAGAWREAADHALRAWSLEFATGRTFRRQPVTWQGLYEILDETAEAHGEPEPVKPHRFGIKLVATE
jgi:hypothetical protein